jgi:hypothetical protein
METKDIITLVVASYGAILSTFVAVKDFRKENKRITITFKWHDRWQIMITNSGHRPVEIVSAEIYMLDPSTFLNHIFRRNLVRYEGRIRSYRIGDAFPDLQTAMPALLKDGEGIGLSLQFGMGPLILEESSEPVKKADYTGILIKVYDAEGKVYKKYIQGVDLL